MALDAGQVAYRSPYSWAPVRLSSGGSKDRSATFRDTMEPDLTTLSEGRLRWTAETLAPGEVPSCRQHQERNEYTTNAPISWRPGWKSMITTTQKIYPGCPEISKVRGYSDAMSFLLVLQLPYSDESDFDRLVALEDDIDLLIEDDDEVDGHDEGQGEMNIFIRTSDPNRAFGRIINRVNEVLGDGSFKAAFREEHGSKYEILWPKGLKDFSVR